MINSFVYKEKGKFYLIPLATEKKVVLENNTEIFQKCDNRKPLRENSIAMCWFDFTPPNKYNIKPAVIVDLTTDDNEKVVAHKVLFDDLIDAAYKAAIQYTARKKQKALLNEKTKVKT
jgi:hypothetical protein